MRHDTAQRALCQIRQGSRQQEAIATDKRAEQQSWRQLTLRAQVAHERQSGTSGPTLLCFSLLRIDRHDQLLARLLQRGVELGPQVREPLRRPVWLPVPGLVSRVIEKP